LIEKLFIAPTLWSSSLHTCHSDSLLGLPSLPSSCLGTQSWKLQLLVLAVKLELHACVLKLELGNQENVHIID